MSRYGLRVCFILLWTSAGLQARNADLSDWIVNLSESAAAAEPGNTDRNPEIVVDGDAVHAVWLEYRSASSDHAICYRRSLDRGVTWEAKYTFYQDDSTLRDINQDALETHLAVANGRVHIAFGAYGGSWFGQLVYLRSVDNGASFEAPRVLWSSVNSPWHAYNVRVKAEGDRVAVCCRRKANWYGHLSLAVYLSDDGGDNFSGSEPAASADGSWSIDDMLLDGDTLALLYARRHYYYGFQNGDLYLAVSDDGGGSYTNSLISHPSSDGDHMTEESHDFHHYSPVLASSGGNVYTCWLGWDAADMRAIFFRRTTDGGQTYEATINLTGGSGIDPATLTSRHTITAVGERVF